MWYKGIFTVSESKENLLLRDFIKNTYMLASYFIRRSYLCALIVKSLHRAENLEVEVNQKHYWS